MCAYFGAEVQLHLERISRIILIRLTNKGESLTLQHFMDTLDNKEPQVSTPVDATETPANTAETSTVEETKTEVREDFNTYDRETLLTKLKDLLDGEELSRHRGAVSAIARVFQTKSKEQTPTEAEAPAEEHTIVDELTEKFNGMMQIFRDKMAEIDAVREKNYADKKTILEKFEILSQEGDLSKSIPQFFSLQREWKAIGPVPSDKREDIQKEYSRFVELFHPMVKMYNEARTEEFNRNYKFKLELCEKLEALREAEDTVEAFTMLKQYRAQWNETGSVPNDKREELNARFSAAAEIVYNRYKQQAEQQRENDNVINEARAAICDELESINLEEATTNRQWDEIVARVTALQTKWRETGEPKFRNSKLGKRYKALCEGIYQARIQFYKRVKASLAENLRKKRELCDEVEQLKESTNWNETANKIADIQKRWKEIGAVSHKNSEALWNQFTSACNYFFERRAEARRGKPEEMENLKKKQEIIERINNFEPTGNNDADRAALRALVDEYSAVGHVPYREKEALHRAYRAACDKQFGQLRGAIGESNTLSAIASGKGLSERSKLMKQFDALKAEIVQYENNLGFLNAASKHGSALVEQVTGKIADLKKQLADITSRITLIDNADNQTESTNEEEAKTEE